MKKLVAAISLSSLVAVPVAAQPKRLERNIEKQREAVEAWTTCIADENRAQVGAMLQRDYRTDAYEKEIKALAAKRVSSECFSAIPRSYRQIELGGLPFAGGLAERMLKQDEEPLLTRLSMAALNSNTQTFSYTDKVANCVVRGAPHLVAVLFDSAINSPEEASALGDIAPVVSACSKDGATIEATPMALRSMLATASYRLLNARGENDDA